MPETVYAVRTPTEGLSTLPRLDDGRAVYVAFERESDAVRTVKDSNTFDLVRRSELSQNERVRIDEAL